MLRGNGWARCMFPSRFRPRRRTQHYNGKNRSPAKRKTGVENRRDEVCYVSAVSAHRARHLKHCTQRSCKQPLYGGAYGTENVRHDGSRLGKSYRLRPPPPRPPAEGQRPSGQVIDGLVALLRYEQRPLPHGHAYWHMGTGQSQSIYSAAAERRADPVGFRFCCQTSSLELPLVRRALAPWYFDASGRDDARDGTRGRCCEEDTYYT